MRKAKNRIMHMISKYDSNKKPIISSKDRHSFDLFHSGGFECDEKWGEISSNSIQQPSVHKILHHALSLSLILVSEFEGIMYTTRRCLARHSPRIILYTQGVYTKQAATRWWILSLSNTLILRPSLPPPSTNSAHSSANGVGQACTT